MSKFREIWNEYLKEPAKELVRSALESLFAFLFKKAKEGLSKVKLPEPEPIIPEFEEEIVDVIKIPVKEPVKVTWVNGVEHHSSRRGADISAIVIHHTGKPPGTKDATLKQTVSWAKNADSKISYHYVIDRDGEIYQLVKEAEKAWHAGRSKYNGKSDWNVFSIGIALVSDGEDDGYTDEQYKSTVFVSKMLQKKYDFTNEWIVGHKTIAPERKHDPADFNWTNFFDLLNLKRL